MVVEVLLVAALHRVEVLDARKELKPSVQSLARLKGLVSWALEFAEEAVQLTWKHFGTLQLERDHSAPAGRVEIALRRWRQGGPPPHPNLLALLR